MKKKVILAALLVAALAVGTTVGLVTKNQSIAQAQTTVNRLVGVTEDGMMYQDATSGRFCYFRLVLNNPGKSIKYIQ
jgi:hypothetical protein